MNVDTDEAKGVHTSPLPIDGPGILQRDAELVAAQPGGDVRMALRVDVRVDAERDAGGAAGGAGTRRDAIELARGFGVDRAHVLRDGVLELAGRLADAREHDVARRKTGTQRHRDLA